MDEFEVEDVWKDEWEKAERRWLLVCHVVGLLASAAILFVVLLVVVKFSRGTAQSQFSLVCEEAAGNPPRESGK